MASANEPEQKKEAWSKDQPEGSDSAVTPTSSDDQGAGGSAVQPVEWMCCVQSAYGQGDPFFLSRKIEGDFSLGV